MFNFYSYKDLSHWIYWAPRKKNYGFGSYTNDGDFGFEKTSFRSAPGWEKRGV